MKVLELQTASEDARAADEITSSSRVRDCLLNGQVQKIHTLLDRPYALILPLDDIANLQGETHQHTHSGWSFPSDLAMSQLPGDGMYAAVVCADSGADVLSAGRLTVRGGQECLMELEQPIDVHGGDANRYLRVELLSRL